MSSSKTSVSPASLTPLLRERWSPRAFEESHALSAADLLPLLEAARWSPSAGNSQPWSFIVGLRGDETFERFFKHLSRGNTSWAGRASALLVSVSQTASGPDKELPFSDYSDYDLGQAAAHLTTQAHASGLHVHQFAGFDHEATAEEFGVPPHWAVKTGIAIGKLAAADTLPEALQIRENAERERRPLSEFVFSGRWGQATDFGG